MKRNGLLVESFKKGQQTHSWCCKRWCRGPSAFKYANLCVCVCVCTWNKYIYIQIYIYCLYILCNVLVAWSYNTGSQKHCVFPGLASVISKTLQIPRSSKNNGYIQEFYVHLPDIGIELGNFLKISFCKSIMHGFVWGGSYLRCVCSELVNSTRHDLSKNKLVQTNSQKRL